MALALFLLVGGALKIGHASGPYTVAVDRSYALQASALAEQSNEQAGQLNHLVATMAGLDRRTLGIQLDDLTADAQATATAAAALSPPSPADGLDQGFATALGDRASAVAEIRGAVDGLLGVTSAAPMGAAPGAAPAGSATGTLLPSDQAADRLSRAGSDLAQSDQAYASVRRALRLAPGNAALPRSVWVTDPTAWAPGPVQTLVAALTGSASLAADHRLQLVSVQVTPAAVPPLGTPPGGPPGAAGACQATNVSILPPTRRLAVDAVVANFGNVAERGATVSAQLQPQGAGTPASASARVALVPGASMAVALPALPTAPGDTYGLSVSVSPPPGQADQSGLAGCYSIRIAPATPPTTTTTVPATTTTRSPGSTTTTGPRPPG